MYLPHTQVLRNRDKRQFRRKTHVAELAVQDEMSFAFPSWQLF